MTRPTKRLTAENLESRTMMAADLLGPAIPLGFVRDVSSQPTQIAAAVSPEVEVCDFDGNGACDVQDLDRLVTVISSGQFHPSQFDLDNDGLVKLSDRDVWLELAGNENIGAPYLIGDANLDGAVDGVDFITWNAHKFESVRGWSMADFNADGVNDAEDFTQWSKNRFDASAIAPTPEPCDFDADGACDIADLDRLVTVVSSGQFHPSQFDLDGDGLVKRSDVNVWLELAGTENIGVPYQMGDANLDGVVDGVDFVAWNDHRFTHARGWSHADFNADGVTDALDFNEWHDNRFQSSVPDRPIVNFEPVNDFQIRLRPDAGLRANLAIDMMFADYQ